jgi:transposase-like protein
MDKVKTLQQAIIYFGDYENCRELMMQLRWPDGKVICPRCGAEKVTYLAKARVWKCYAKHKSPTFTLKTGTIFEDSPLGLDKWLAALWLVVNCKNGISSCEVARDLGITQKSAWFVCHRLRTALQDGGFGKLSGEVEVDETFIGGKARNMHASKRKGKIAGTGGYGKIAVMGLLERHGEVRTMVVPNTRRKSLHGQVTQHVEQGSTVYSDSYRSYRRLEDEFIHNVINHAEEYVRGNVHTNGIENYWSLLKRALGGTYISVEPFHLFRYLDEQSFRFNNRKGLKDADRFLLALSRITGKRLTYSELTGKDREPINVTAH